MRNDRSLIKVTSRSLYTIRYVLTRDLNCSLLQINPLYMWNGINYAPEVHLCVRVKLPITFAGGHRLLLRETIQGKRYACICVQEHNAFSSCALVTVKFIVINFPICSAYRRMDVAGKARYFRVCINVVQCHLSAMCCAAFVFNHTCTRRFKLKVFLFFFWRKFRVFDFCRFPVARCNNFLRNG